MSESSTQRGITQPLVLAAAILFAYWSVLAGLAHLWWTDENYSHGLLIPFLVGYIIWTERAGLERAARRPAHVWGVLVVACALAALWVGTAGAEQFIQRTSLVLLLGGVVVYFWGARVLRLLLVPLLLLALAIPIPALIFNKVAFPLQLFASRCAVWVMRLFQIPVLRQGNVIELLPLNSTTTKKLEVVEACSGIRSLMTLVTLAVVFAYFTAPPDETTADAARAPRLRRFRILRATLVVVAAVPIAIITNAMRVSGTGVLARYYGTQVADGFFHSFSGWVMYIVAFLLLFAFGWLIDRFNPSERGLAGAGAEARAVAASHADQQAVGGSAAPVVPVGGGKGRAG